MRYSLLPDASFISYASLPRTRGVGDWFSDLVTAGTNIGETVLTGNAPGTPAAGTVAPKPPAAPGSSNTMLWVGVAGLGIALFFLMKRRR